MSGGPLFARLTWQAADPEQCAADLAHRLATKVVPHSRIGDAYRLVLGVAELEIVPWQRETAGDDPRRDGRLVLEPATGEAPGEPVGTGLTLAAIAWATVDLDRAETELGQWLAPSGDPPGDRPDPLLGARARLRTPAGLPGLGFVLLEPTTEGRLAASLARDGEGPCGMYLRPTEGLAAWLGAARARGVATSPRSTGPFGPAVLVVGASAAGPHLIVVDDLAPVRTDRPATMGR